MLREAVQVLGEESGPRGMSRAGLQQSLLPLP